MPGLWQGVARVLKEVFLELKQAGAELSGIRGQVFGDLQKGSVITINRTFGQDETEAFGDLTRDYNPVHYEPSFAKVSGYPELICHGLLIGGMICEIGGQLAWLAGSMNFKYIKPVYFGDTITCRFEITSLEESGRAAAEADFTNQKGELILKAHLTGYIPVGAKKEVLAKMVEEDDPTNKLA